MKKFTSTGVIFAVIICIVESLIETDTSGAKDECVSDCNECRKMCDEKSNRDEYLCFLSPKTKNVQLCHCHGYGDLISCQDTIGYNKPNDAVRLSTFGIAEGIPNKRENELVPEKANCKKGTLYHDGCNWCQCLGKGRVKCDSGPCVVDSDEEIVTPSQRKLHQHNN